MADDFTGSSSLLVIADAFRPMLGPHIMVLHVAKQSSSLKAMSERKEKRKGVESFPP